MYPKAFKLCLLLAWLTTAARADFVYETNDHGGITILRGDCAPTVVIPAEIDGLPVTGLGTYAFHYCLDLVSVTIPPTVKVIGNQAFAECRNLTNLTLSVGLEHIDQGAFYFCSGLTDLSLPNTVTNIGDSAFTYTGLASVAIPGSVARIGHTAFSLTPLTNVALPSSVTEVASTAFNACSRLAEISVAPLNPAYLSRDGVLFTRPMETLVTFPPARSGSYAVPEGVRSIADWAFAACRGLTNLTLPTTLTNIGESSFSECDSLRTVTIPKSVLFVDDSAFHTSLAHLRSVFFEGDAPAITVRSFDHSAKFYYLPGTTGWEQFTNSFPALNASLTLWNPQIRTDQPDFGIRNDQFSFTITGTPDIPIIVQASGDLAPAVWTTLQNCTPTNGSIYFTDFLNQGRRFYRLRSP